MDMVVFAVVLSVLNLFGMTACIVGLCKYCKIGSVALVGLITIVEICICMGIIAIAQAYQSAGTSALIPTNMSVQGLRQYYPDENCELPVGDANDYAIIKERK